MTTSNGIVAHVLKQVLFVPLETLHAQGDSLTFVYKQDGATFVKQQVKVGQTNDNEAVILEGLNESEKVFLSVPANAEGKQLVLLPGASKQPKKNTDATLSSRK
jgi:hypothetical protein